MFSDLKYSVLQLKAIITSVGKDVEKLELSYIARGNVRGYSHKVTT